jgi:uncharacterized protein YkwD
VFVLSAESKNPYLKRAKGVKNLNFLNTHEKEVVIELNRARTNPKAYAAFLIELKKSYQDYYFVGPNKKLYLTKEGVSAVNEAIRFLKSTKPLKSLKVSKGLSLAAKTHVKDQGTKGRTGHRGSDRSMPMQRMSRFGKWKVISGENLCYGYKSPRQIVMHLIIDDGIKDRNHRKNIFEPLFQIIGISCGYHSRLKWMCVMDFAGGFLEKK